MSAAMRELRSAVMILVEASWEDPSGTPQSVAARMEDKSASGACIRVKMPIQVGSKVRIQGRWDQFTGTAKYCRSEGREFLVGIQKDKSLAPGRPAQGDTPPTDAVRVPEAVAAQAKIDGLKGPQEKPCQSNPGDILVAKATPQGEPGMRIAGRATVLPTRAGGPEVYSRERFGMPGRQDSDALRRNEIRRNRPGKENEAGKERKPMTRKWLELGPWHHKSEGAAVSGKISAETSGSGNGNGKAEHPSPRLWPVAEKAVAPVAEEVVASFHADLLPLEDIYRAAGIANPRKGYSIHKVVEMLGSEHIRGLSKEMKRAAVLMALDVAGVSVDEVQQDAKAREEALDSYEAEQRKQVDAEWARKAEENIQIQADLERIKARYMARMSRNLEGVAREKSAFGSWLTIKQKEAQSIAEARELCAKAVAAEPASVTLTNSGSAVAGAGLA